jgi:hypothetical protein
MATTKVAELSTVGSGVRRVCTCEGRAALYHGWTVAVAAVRHTAHIPCGCGRGGNNATRSTCTQARLHIAEYISEIAKACSFFEIGVFLTQGSALHTSAGDDTIELSSSVPFCEGGALLLRVLPDIAAHCVYQATKITFQANQQHWIL